MRLTSVLIALLAMACNAAAAELPTSPRAESVILQETPVLSAALAAKDLKLGMPVYIAIYKEERQLEVWVEAMDGKYKLFKGYSICAMSGGLGPKVSQGDRQAPEGFYEVGASQLNPSSAYHLSFNVGYPNAYDRSQSHTGADLMIHGDCRSIGCYAMTDKNMDEIYTLVHAALANDVLSVPVAIYPFRMTAANMENHKMRTWYAFWQNLKQGYDAFEKTQRPPRVTISGGNYMVAPG